MRIPAKARQKVHVEDGVVHVMIPLHDLEELSKLRPDHADRRKKYFSKWKKKNRARFAAYMAAYRDRHREAIRAYQRLALG